MSYCRSIPSSTNWATASIDDSMRFWGAKAPTYTMRVMSMEAVAQLVEEGINLQYDIVGGGTHFDVIKGQWDKLSEEVKKRICLHGAKYGDALVPFFRKADVFLMPGTGGLGVNEAMAYGLPIISTEGDETVVDLMEGNGYLLQHMGSVEEQKETIKKFVELSAAEKQVMSKRSWDLVLQRAPLKNMVEKDVLACERMIGLQQTEQ